MKKFLFMCLLPVALWGQSAQVVLDSTTQAGLIAQALRSYYTIEGALELTPVLELPAISSVPTSIEILEAPAQPASLMTLRVRYLADGAEIARVSGAFRAQWRVSALVARVQLPRNSAIDLSTLDTQTVDRLALRQAPVQPGAALSDYAIASNVPAGTILTWNYLKAQPLVHKGSLVDVVAHEGNLRITSRAVATQDAGRGEAVVMKNITTNRQFEAYVINENLVQIRF